MVHTQISINRSLAFRLLTCWFVITRTFPPYFYFVHMGEALTIALFILVSLIIYPRLIVKPTVLALSLYFLVTYCFFKSGNAFFPTINSVLVPFLNMLSSLIIVEYSLARRSDHSFVKCIVWVFIICTVIMIFLSIPQLAINPNIIRGASLSSVDEGTVSTKLYYWVISYGTVHGLSFTVAPIFFICKKQFANNKRGFILWLTILLLFLTIIFLSNATTAFLITAIIIIVSILIRTDSLKKGTMSKVIVLGILAYLLTTPTIVVPVIDTAQSLINEQSANYKKLGQIKDKVAYGDSEGDLDARESLYKSSLSLFRESPINGTDTPERISHHSFFLDRLALFGIIFIIPLLLIFIIHFKSVYLSLSHSRIPYVMGVSAYLMMLLLKNEFGTGTWLYAFAILPILCYYLDIENGNKSINTKN